MAFAAPTDRKFRPDVQGLRAVAILLVVLYHASISALSGGYIGVDVFFVISGFVITGVLLRERASTGTTSILAFYGRRARRIIPAATLVIIATVVASFLILGPATGWNTAVDGRWASLFLANFHFAQPTTNYLLSQRPPSPLQNYWSLAVEEQFYIVYPTVFWIVAGRLTRLSLRARLGSVLGLTVIGSYALSIVMTSTNAASAYFSPFTRAWELALGGLVAVAGDGLRRLPHVIAAGASWLGLGGILLAAFLFSSTTAYPGSLVAIPVIGTALIIAGGTAQPRWGVESVLRQRPFQLVGLISYSLYLWHWPILVIAAQHQGKTTLSIRDNLLLVMLAVVLAIGTYLIVENPIRHARYLMKTRWASVAMGMCLIISSLGVTSFEVVRYQNVANADTLAQAASGSRCPSSTKSQIAALHFDSHSEPKATSASGVPTRMVVAGDSTACTMLVGLDAVGPSYGIRVENAAVIGCGIVSGRIAPFYSFGVDLERFTGDCQQRAVGAEDSALKLGTPNIIVWSSSFEKDSIIVDTPAGKEKILHRGSPRWTAVMLQRIETRLQRFIATGATVVILLQPPFVNAGSPSQPTSTDADTERLNTLLQEVSARHTGHVGVVNLAARVCPSGPPCPYVVGGLVVRPDDAHYGPAGSLWVARWLIPQILGAVKSAS